MNQTLKHTKTTILHFGTDISIQSAQIFKSVILSFANDGVEKLIVHISSTGGDFNAAFDIVSTILSSPIQIHMHNSGYVESAAVLVYLAAQTRTAEDYSRFMIHGPFLQTGCPIDMNYVNTIMKALKLDIKRYTDFFNERTNSGNGQFNILDILSSQDHFVFGVDFALKSNIVTAGFTVESISPPGSARFNVGT